MQSGSNTFFPVHHRADVAMLEESLQVLLLLFVLPYAHREPVS